MFSFFIQLLPFSNMINNILFIQNHSNLSYDVEENQFINRTYINDFYDDDNHYIINQPNHIINNNYNDNYPESIDWRDYHKVSSIKNQLSCGGCWAFSASEAVESKWAIDNNILYNLSQQELIDCSGEYGNHGCKGGSMDYAFQYIIDNGLCTNISYPYTASEGECMKDQCESVIKINNYSNIIPNNENILKKVVALQPVSVAIQANKRSFQFYKSGIYSDLDCGTQLDHGVLIIGYGYDYLYNMKYWIVKNSWGPSWGENGYIRILRDIDDSRGLCGIAMQPSIPI